MPSTGSAKPDPTTTISGSNQSKENANTILKSLNVVTTDETTKSDLLDFVSWIWKKAEQLGFKVEIRNK